MKGIIRAIPLALFPKRQARKAAEARDKASQTRQSAYRAYLDALDRGDTRDQHTTMDAFRAATMECLRLAG